MAKPAIMQDIIFLGSASQYPSPRRALNSIVMRNSHGDNWLFDCGEGTQTRMMESHAKPGKLKKIFLSHLHGDHVFGLPGLMCSIGQAMRSIEEEGKENKLTAARENLKKADLELFTGLPNAENFLEMSSWGCEIF